MITKLGLGDNFPRKLLHLPKSRLGVGLIERNTVIEILAIRLHVGNIIFQGDVCKIVDLHEENSFIHSGLTKDGRKMHSNH